uniref:interleukin-1 receptor-associated kinase 3-like isoform X2 n=1 Tax=Myxine glutinosa TaxID=7769 RepID=UPI00358F975A
MASPRRACLCLDTFVYDIPPLVMQSLCRVMDTCDGAVGYRALAYHLARDMTELLIMLQNGQTGQNRSCTEHLLWTWGQQNHTVHELLVALDDVGNKRAYWLLLNESFGVYHIADAELPLPGPPPSATFCGNDCPCHIRSSSSKSGDSSSSSSLSSNSSSCNKNSRPSSPFTPNWDSAHIKAQQEEARLNGDAAVCYQKPVPICSPSSIEVQPIFSLTSIREATGDFGPEARIGEGAFGVVFKANIHHTNFAIKRLKQNNGTQWNSQWQNLQSEIKLQFMLRHPNILELVGYCMESGICCLVYQHMERGSLDNLLHLQEAPSLSLPERLLIAVGVACGLQYLHMSQQHPIIHGDVKSANVLLDKFMSPRLGDFGLAKMWPFKCGKTYTNLSSKALRGTLAYLPQEYVRSGRLSVKVDTYSFGVVLLEILTGKKAMVENPKPKFLKELVEDEMLDCDDDVVKASQHLFDPRAGSFSVVQAPMVLRLALSCIGKHSARPEMTSVLKELQDIERVSADPLSTPTQNNAPASFPTQVTDVLSQHLYPGITRQGPVEVTDTSVNSTHSPTSKYFSSVRATSFPSPGSFPQSRIPCESDDLSSSTNVSYQLQRPTESATKTAATAATAKPAPCKQFSIEQLEKRTKDGNCNKVEGNAADECAEDRRMMAASQVLDLSSLHQSLSEAIRDGHHNVLENARPAEVLHPVHVHPARCRMEKKMCDYEQGYIDSRELFSENGSLASGESQMPVQSEEARKSS